MSKPRKGYSGYRITHSGRLYLLMNISPKFSKVIAHHVTHEFGVTESLPPNAEEVKVIAVANNEKIQAAVVEVDGVSVRPDGGVYHITISLDSDSDASPKDSNALLKDIVNWNEIQPFYVEVKPEFFPF